MGAEIYHIKLKVQSFTLGKEIKKAGQVSRSKNFYKSRTFNTCSTIIDKKEILKKDSIIRNRVERLLSKKGADMIYEVVDLEVLSSIGNSMHDNPTQ